jgi:hypothetical protein
MAEENEGGKTAEEGAENEFKPITSQEDLDKLIGARINKVKSQFADYDDIKTKAAEFDKAQEASKTELEKAAERAAQAERERDELRLAHARAEVALAKGLTPTQAKRLVGTTKDELEADADELLADLVHQGQGRPQEPQVRLVWLVGATDGQGKGRCRAAPDAHRHLKTPARNDLGG